MKESLDSHLREVELLLADKETLTPEESHLLDDIRALRSKDVPEAFTEEGEVKEESRGPLAGKLEDLMRRMASDHPETMRRISAILTGLSRTGI